MSWSCHFIPFRRVTEIGPFAPSAGHGDEVLCVYCIECPMQPCRPAALPPALVTLAILVSPGLSVCLFDVGLGWVTVIKWPM